MLQISMFYIKGTAKKEATNKKWEAPGILCKSTLAQKGLSRDLRELWSVCNKSCHSK